jgi:hypothetical protein
MRTFAKPRHVNGFGVSDGLVCVGRIGSSVLAVALSALKRGMYMPNATWRRRG